MWIMYALNMTVANAGVTVVVAIALIAIVALAFVKRIDVTAWQRAVVSHKGRISVLEPGRHWIARGAVVTFIDNREDYVHLAGQEIMSADGVHARYGVYAMYRVSDPRAYVTHVQSPTAVLYKLLQSALRSVVQSLRVEDISAQGAQVAEQVKALAESGAAELGIELVGVHLLDVQLPNDLKRAIAGIEVERRTQQLNLEKARREIATLRALANAARMLSDAPNLEKLRKLHILEGAVATPRGAVNLHFGKED